MKLKIIFAKFKTVLLCRNRAADTCLVMHAVGRRAILSVSKYKVSVNTTFSMGLIPFVCVVELKEFEET